MAMSSMNGVHILVRVGIFLFTNTHTHPAPNVVIPSQS